MLQVNEGIARHPDRVPLLIIRDVVPADLESVLKVEEKSFEPLQRYPLTVFEHYIRRRAIFKVAEHCGKVVGYVLAETENGSCHVISVAVLPEYRRLGIGRALVESAIGECRRRGSTIAYLEVHVENEAAIGLYRKLDFKVVGLIRDYYGAGKHAYLMYKEL